MHHLFTKKNKLFEPTKNCTIFFFFILAFFHSHKAWAERSANIKAVSALTAQIKKYDLSSFYFEENGAELLYIGTRHTYDPKNPEIEGIELLFNAFAPTLVLIEGGDWPVAENKTQAIRKYGELGFTRFLAAKAKTLALSADASAEEELAEVQKYHSPTDIKLYYALRFVPQWRNQETGLSIDENMAKLLASEKFSRHFPDNTPPQNITELVQVCAARIPEMRDWRSVQFDLSFDGAKKSRLTQIDVTVANFRNNHMKNQIVKGLRKKERVFIISGATHLAKIAPLFQGKIPTEEMAFKQIMSQ